MRDPGCLLDPHHCCCLRALITRMQVPPRTLNPLRDGAFGWIKREGVAYVSNMAVLPQARRMGTARALMEVGRVL
jgi:ribosomal protein S18 acetylase RimI-like enzyme